MLTLRGPRVSPLALEVLLILPSSIILLGKGVHHGSDAENRPHSLPFEGECDSLQGICQTSGRPEE